MPRVKHIVPKEEVLRHWILQDQDWATTKSRTWSFSGHRLYENTNHHDKPYHRGTVVECPGGNRLIVSWAGYYEDRTIRAAVSGSENVMYYNLWVDDSDACGSVPMYILGYLSLYTEYYGISTYERLKNVLGIFNDRRTKVRELREFCGISRDKYAEYLGQKMHKTAQQALLLLNMAFGDEKTDVMQLFIDYMNEFSHDAMRHIRDNIPEFVSWFSRASQELNINDSHNEFAHVWAEIIK